ncbi:MAG TPA: DUF3738 domain-containing protein [Candidatus Saccharimonadales bacterium]|nr:DUF3738 domain-containing protein [Candidatus Saccharimonadales bacterium]
MAWKKLRIAVLGAAVLHVAMLSVHNVEAAEDYSWEVPHPTLADFTNAQPQLTILPSKFHQQGDWRMVRAVDGACLGIHVTVEQMFQIAANASPVLNGIRAKVAAPLPGGEYDFICNLPVGASNALARALAVKFGLMASLQMVETNALVLSIRNPDASALQRSKKVSDKKRTKYHRPPPIQKLIDQIDAYFNLPVVDQTGLAANSNIDLTWRIPPANASLEPFSQALFNQLGMELTPKSQPIQMLVIEKAPAK